MFSIALKKRDFQFCSIKSYNHHNLDEFLCMCEVLQRLYALEVYKDFLNRIAKGQIWTNQYTERRLLKTMSTIACWTFTYLMLNIAHLAGVQLRLWTINGQSKNHIINTHNGTKVGKKSIKVRRKKKTNTSTQTAKDKWSGSSFYPVSIKRESLR